jgi:hypothetical protein
VASAVGLRPRRVIEVLFAFVFALSAGLQGNDPDPARWFAIYVAAMILCVFAEDTVVVRWVPLGLAAIATIWGATLVPGVLREAELADLVRTMKHENHAEEARELGGLLVVALVMTAIGLRPAPLSGPGHDAAPRPPGPPPPP